MPKKKKTIIQKKYFAALFGLDSKKMYPTVQMGFFLLSERTVLLYCVDLLVRETFSPLSWKVLQFLPAVNFLWSKEGWLLPSLWQLVHCYDLLPLSNLSLFSKSTLFLKTFLLISSTFVPGTVCWLSYNPPFWLMVIMYCIQNSDGIIFVVL